MANFIVSYDLNGPNPSHQEVDALLERLGATRARILETVWYVGWSGSRADLFREIDALLNRNDQVIVLEAVDASFRNLLVESASFIAAWNANR
ncbi:MAG: hypothetical protein MH112_01930 [Phenylobacterium sp.]|uniref:hypothetical protein n=1 Tax=Phenylobacterium sp. TaxID=1871053 RepID=UPI0025CD3069|nr:hypothetical protein [Phenylobacterium sp.]MCG9915103.1 hypothetical protein [Phenylobacterium sp.]